MGEWRKAKGQQQRKREADRWGPSNSSSGSGGSSYRSWSRNKPPRFPDERTEVHWEERFCQLNGIEWKQILEIKRYISQYKNISNWDDSAAKEAFDNAKSRFWAQINGLPPPEIPLPDPDSLLDFIDHDAPICISQHKLYKNLRGSLSEDENDDYWGKNDWNSDDYWGEGGVILWDSHYEKKEEDVIWDGNNLTAGWGENNYPIAATGWGDNLVDDPTDGKPPGGMYESIVPTGWGDNLVDDPTDGKPPGGMYESIVPTGWGNTEEEEVSRDQWNNGVINDGNYYSGNGGNWYHQNNNNSNGWYQNQNQNQNHGYDYGGNYYWNGNNQVNTGNWGNNNYNHYNSENFSGENNNGYRNSWNSWNRHGAGRGKNGNNNNKMFNKGKQWRKREDSSNRFFCAPLNQTTQNNDGWNVPRSVV